MSVFTVGVGDKRSRDGRVACGDGRREKIKEDRSKFVAMEVCRFAHS